MTQAELLETLNALDVPAAFSSPGAAHDFFAPPVGAGSLNRGVMPLYLMRGTLQRLANLMRDKTGLLRKPAVPLPVEQLRAFSERMVSPRADIVPTIIPPQWNRFAKGPLGAWRMDVSSGGVSIPQRVGEVLRRLEKSEMMDEGRQAAKFKMMLDDYLGGGN